MEKSQQIILPALHPTQIEVQSNQARFKVIAAGRRWGKGMLGIGECVRRASMALKCWWVVPSFASAAYQAGWKMLEFYHHQIPFTELKLQARSLVLPNGGWVQFKTSEEPDSLRGESIDFLVVDEAAHIPKFKDTWELALRPTLVDRRGEAWFISTPKGFNAFNELFLKGRRGEAGWASFQFSSHANPHLDPAELADIAKDLPALVKRQEIDAEFVQLAGAMFKRDAVRVLESEPAGLRWVRSWDLAFTTKTSSDYTVGAKVGLMADGTVVVSDVIRGRWEWPTAVRTISETAKADGVAVEQGVEVVGAQVAALQILLSDPQLVGLTFTPVPVHADKITRVLPVVARAEQGRLAILRAGWNREFLEEISAFPETKHDDQVDALSSAVALLAPPSTDGAFNEQTAREFINMNKPSLDFTPLRFQNVRPWQSARSRGWP